MKKETIRLLLLSMASLNILSVAFSNSLTGRLDKFGILGLLPASYVNVTLSNKDGVNLKTVITESDGKYLFNDIRPGPYILKIWVKGFDLDPLKRDVEVYDDRETTEVNHILIHDFAIEYPKEKNLSSSIMLPFIEEEGLRITAYGSHYALPDDAIIWPVLKCKNGNYFLSTEKPIAVSKKDGKWKSREIVIDRPVEAIIAVLVTKAGDNKMRIIMSTNSWREFSSLPEDSYILAQNRIGIN